MSYMGFTDDIIYIISDLTAGAFLITLIISITLQTEKRREPAHLMASEILLLAGIFVRLFAGTVEILPEDFVWRSAAQALLPVSPEVLWTAAFLLITFGISEAAAYVIYINDGRGRSNIKSRFAASGIIFAAGAIIYACTGNINAFTICNLVQFAVLLVDIRRCCSAAVMYQFGRASLMAIITCAIALIYHPLRLTGFGLSVMLVILNEHYHDYIVRELADNEEELAKGRVQLLAEQISPHYIYNSLQSIRWLCDTDPAKARDAIDSFSEFLRGNLESLTIEELIPFARELELTQAYLDLEKLTGRGRFDVEYQLETTDFMLPPLVLQPVVENAVKHGTARAAIGHEPESNAVTHITIATSELGGSVRIEVTDRMEGCESTAVLEPANNLAKKKSVGLDNVRTRLDIQCSGKLEMESIENGTKVTMLLPKTQIVTTQ